MRRTFGALILALMLLGWAAAPAVAQRDPFQPIGGGEVQPEEEEDEEEPAEDDEEEEDEAEDEGQAGGDELADTGADVEPMLVLAYALLAFGVAAVIVGGLYANNHHSSRRRP